MRRNTKRHRRLGKKRTLGFPTSLQETVGRDEEGLNFIDSRRLHTLHNGRELHAWTAAALPTLLTTPCTHLEEHGELLVLARADAQRVERVRLVATEDGARVLERLPLLPLKLKKSYRSRAMTEQKRRNVKLSSSVPWKRTTNVLEILFIGIG